MSPDDIVPGKSRCAAHLRFVDRSTRPGLLCGADDGTRTRDPHLGKVMLYQLSHVRVEGQQGSNHAADSERRSDELDIADDVDQCWVGVVERSPQDVVELVATPHATSVPTMRSDTVRAWGDGGDTAT